MKIEAPYMDTTLRGEVGDCAWLRTISIAGQDLPTVTVDQIEACCVDIVQRLRQKKAPFSSMEKVVIVVSDSFRATAVDEILPTLLSMLLSEGVAEEAIHFLVATGTHRGPTDEEQRKILGVDVYNRFGQRLHVHDARDSDGCVSLGETSRGTPVSINRLAVDADALIVTGTVVLHYFGGFGGGRKAVVPGVAAVETIAANHCLNLHPTEYKLNPAVRIGATVGNPVSEDMLEAARFVEVDGILNTVLNPNGQMVGLFAGEMVDAHLEAAEFAMSLYGVPIDEPADLVIASSPQTRNFIQTHKALYNAYRATHPEGRIILLSPCQEGLGSEGFVSWLQKGSRTDIIQGLRENSDINGQTALSTREKASITTMVTELNDADIACLGMQKASTLQEALDDALGALRSQGISSPRVCLMPSAGYTVPLMQEIGAAAQ